MIHVTADKGKFIAKCPFHMNGQIRNIPGARWSAPRKAYMIPFSRKAAEVMSAMTSSVVFDQSAVELMITAIRPKIQKSTFPPWYRFKTDPMKHQRGALDFLWEKEAAALFMAMRTGKTKTVIDWACAMKMDDRVDHVVVFSPLSVRGGWEAQIAEHSPLEATVGRFDLSSKSGQNAHRNFIKSDIPFKFMLVGVESMGSGSAFNQVFDFVYGNGRVLCVVDESHLIKTHNATRSEKITTIGGMCTHRVILTGTPIAATPLDLYSQFNYLDPDIIGFGDYYSFKNEYAVMGGYEMKKVVGYENLDKLMSDIAPYVFQVNAEEVTELPPKTYQIREVELPAAIRSIYNRMKRSDVIEHGDKLLVINGPLDKLIRQSMLVNGVMCTGESGVYEHTWINSVKIEEMCNVIEENPVPTVVWTTGRMELAAVVTRLKKDGRSVVELHGGVKEDDRIEAIRQFQVGEVDYMVSNVAVGGTGTKLNRARMMIYMSNSFKYIDRKQSEERATDFLDIGAGVLIVDIVAVNTVDDEVIQPALKNKMDVAQFVNSEIGKLNNSSTTSGSMV